MAKRKYNYSGIRTVLPQKGKHENKSSFSPSKMSIYEVIEHYNTNTDNGLSNQEVQRRRKKKGMNILYPEFKRTFVLAFCDHVKSVVSVLLALSLFVFYAFYGDINYLISAAIVSFCLLSDCILEHISSKKFESVRKSSSLKAVVKRNGKVYITDSRNLVPGDLVFLQQGSIVPADIRLFDSNGLIVFETPITGVDDAIKKYAKDVYDDEDANINMTFAGSIVSEGNAWGIVCLTGNETKFHSIPENNHNNVPALFKYVYSVSSMISIISSFLGCISLIFGLFFTSSLTSIYLTTLTIAFCSFCDGVVSLSALSFALGISELKDEGVILRNLSSVEQLALTSSLLVKQNTVFPVLKTEVENFFLGLDKISDTEEEKELIKYLLVCSDVRKVFSKKTKMKSEFEGKQNSVAIASYGESRGVKFDSISKEFLITETNKSETNDWFSALAFSNGQKYMFIKGNPNDVLPLCKYHNTTHGMKTMSENDLDNYYTFSSSMTNDAGYILAIAKCETGLDKLSDYDDSPILTLCGFVKFTTFFGIDFFKEVLECKNSGIDVSLFSSDAYMKAYNLSKNSGIFTKNEQVITSDEMKYMSKKEFSRSFAKYKLFLNLTPSMLNDVLMLRKGKGDIVGVSAESTNDLLIMKNSDVSFVIDGDSSDMIKQSSDVILDKGGFDKINKVLATSKKIYRRVHAICEYSFYNYLSAFLLFILGNIFGLKIRQFDYLIGATLISSIICFFIATTPISSKGKNVFPVKRKKVANPKRFLPSIIYAAECAVCTVVLSTVFNESSQATLLITFSAFSFFVAITFLNENTPFYENYIGFNRFTIMTVIIIMIIIMCLIFVPSISNILGYGKMSIWGIVFSTFAPFIFFIINSFLIKLGKIKI